MSQGSSVLKPTAVGTPMPMSSKPIPVDPPPQYTRIAPSPTGGMHLGTLRTAYFNWLAARASKGQFLVRIDDTDAARNQADKGQEFFDTLNYCSVLKVRMFGFLRLF